MTFATPILLVGLAAAALPLVLHLVSRVRARQEEFPTLRFLRISLVKTARRRKVRNWFLLLLRSLLLAVLALAVAEPLSRATGWFASEGQAVAIVLDDSYSQATASAKNKNSPSRFARARADIESLLGGKDKPALASLLKTCDTHPPKPLTAQLDAIRKTLAQARTQPGLSSLARSVAQAIELLEKQSNPQHAIYIFSDLQKLSFDPLTKLDALARAKDIPIFIVDSSQGVVDNVGITSLETQGDAIVDGQVKFVATLRNSSPRPKRAEVLFSVFNKSKPSDSKAEVQARAVRNLAPAGEPGDVVEVVFEHKFGTAGLVSGQVSLSRSDDLLVDNIRKFRLTVRPRSRALIVSNSQNGQGSISPGDVLALALDWRDEQHRDKPWPIHVARLEATKFSPESFKNIDAAFFCDVPTFTDAQARAMGQFQPGRSSCFFPRAKCSARQLQPPAGQGWRRPAAGPARPGHRLGRPGSSRPDRRKNGHRPSAAGGAFRQPVGISRGVGAAVFSAEGSGETPAVMAGVDATARGSAFVAPARSASRAGALVPDERRAEVVVSALGQHLPADDDTPNLASKRNAARPARQPRASQSLRAGEQPGCLPARATASRPAQTRPLEGVHRPEPVRCAGDGERRISRAKLVGRTYRSGDTAAGARSRPGQPSSRRTQR